jgi:hypothetical protein
MIFERQRVPEIVLQDGFRGLCSRLMIEGRNLPYRSIAALFDDQRAVPLDG